MMPLVRSVRFVEDPFDLYRHLDPGGPRVLLESARPCPRSGRYSFIARRPSQILQSREGRTWLRRGRTERRIQGNALEVLRRLLKARAHPHREGWPPFVGGAVGYLGYEAKQLLDPRLARSTPDDLRLPDAYFLLFEEGIVIDHVRRKTHLFSAVPAGLRRLESEVRAAGRRSLGIRPVYEKPSDAPVVECSMTRREFTNRVKKAKQYIRSGDIYQANLSQRFRFPCRPAPDIIYEKLRRINPSSFFGILDAVDFQILSGSPERLLKIENGDIETRPIAGTRGRGRNETEDRNLSRDLLLSEKERAEHIMLVDLERNDLGRVSEFGSVRVDELMALEDYSHVKHIVSNVRGRLRKGLDGLDALRSFFPGGTITGAPKIRCMDIIDELEPVARGPYTGSMGYWSYSGNMDFNILIRSLVLKNGEAVLQAGAGIVADSQPDKEYEETLYKAEAVFSALFGAHATRKFYRSCLEDGRNIARSASALAR